MPANYPYNISNMKGFFMDPVLQMVFLIALIIILGALGEFIFTRTSIPDMVWLVAAGIVAGPVLKIISPDMLTPIMPFFGAIALIAILAGGGLKLRISEVTEAAPRAITLGFVGFLFVIIGACLFFLVTTKLGLTKSTNVMVWVMIGAIMGGTSSLVVIPAMSSATVDSRVARLLELESCVTDALCMVVALSVIDLVVQGTFSLNDPLIAISQAVLVALVFGVVGAITLAPLLAMLRGSDHAYTVFLAGFLVIYGCINLAGGNGALGVLVTALLIGNSKDILKLLHITRFKKSSYQYRPSDLVVHDHISFFIKSFFFFMIGLMFPTSLRLILLGAAFAVMLLVFRWPAVKLSLWGAGLSRSQQALATVAIPRGMAAGVLSMIPFQKGVPYTENLVSAVFAGIVFSILLFTIGFALVQKSAKPSPEMD